MHEISESKVWQLCPKQWQQLSSKTKAKQNFVGCFHSRMLLQAHFGFDLVSFWFSEKNLSDSRINNWYRFETSSHWLFASKGPTTKNSQGAQLWPFSKNSERSVFKLELLITLYSSRRRTATFCSQCIQCSGQWGISPWPTGRSYFGSCSEISRNNQRKSKKSKSYGS